MHGNVSKYHLTLSLSLLRLSVLINIIFRKCDFAENCEWRLNKIKEHAQRRRDL
jgi:hypothetical protein